MKNYALAVLALSLVACAAPDQARITDIATTPLSDLSLVEKDIPPILLEASQHPYRPPAGQGCDVLLAQVLILDEVLGPDIDAPAGPEAGRVERAKSAASKAAVGALQKTVEGAIPFRGWVRKLSGAERHSRKVDAAIAAGTVRRGFLKGMAVARGCPSAYVDA